MKRFEERSKRQRSAINAAATVLLVPAKLFEFAGAALMVLGAGMGFYVLGLLAWEGLKAL